MLGESAHLAAGAVELTLFGVVFCIFAFFDVAFCVGRREWRAFGLAMLIGAALCTVAAILFATIPG